MLKMNMLGLISFLTLLCPILSHFATVLFCQNFLPARPNMAFLVRRGVALGKNSAAGY